jgi:hypothetical protein
MQQCCVQVLIPQGVWVPPAREIRLRFIRMHELRLRAQATLPSTSIFVCLPLCLVMIYLCTYPLYFE